MLYFDGCANWVEAVANLEAALHDTGNDDVAIEFVKVETPEAAIGARFRGSPTFIVNGSDLFDEPGLGFGLTCRRYLTPHGMSGAPTTEQLIEKIRRVTSGSS